MKKIKLVDTKKWLIRSGISLLIYFIICILFIVPMVNEGKINMLWIIVLLFIWIIYIIFEYKTCKKLVDKIEFRKEMKNLDNSYKIKLLKNQGFNKDEIEDIIDSEISNDEYIGNDYKFNHKYQFELLEKDGFNINEKYFGSNGNGVILDRNHKVVILISNNVSKPFIISFVNLKGCEELELVEEIISSSDPGLNGMILDNKKLKELGNYSSRDIKPVYTKLGIILLIEENGIIDNMEVPFINGRKYVYASESDKIISKKAVININKALEDYNKD